MKTQMQWGDKMLTFEQATQMRNAFEAQMNEAAKALRAIPGIGSGCMGLTPDSVKVGADYQDAKRRFEWDFDNLRKFNAWYVKAFKRELAQMRRKKYENS